MTGKNPIAAPEKSVAFIVARLGSSRLPEKQFRKIGPKSMLEWILERLKSCAQLDEIILATTAEPENNPLVSWCASQALPCFRYQGDINHVTTRLRRAAEHFSADICVLISGDCPLIDSRAIDFLISQLRQNPEADLVNVKPNLEGMPPALQGVGIARKRAWQRADDLSDTDQLKEHHFPIMQQQPDRFPSIMVTLDPQLYDPFAHRYSVDTWADLEFHNALYDTLTQQSRRYNLPNAITLLQEKPSLLSVNSHVHQKGVDEKSRTVLVVADAGHGLGYGHLMRTRELALQITERLGWPVTFMVNDEHAGKLLTEVGFRVILSAERAANKISKTAGVDRGKEILISENLDAQALPAFPFFDLILLDLSSNRILPSGWRDVFPAACRVILLDRLEPSSREADLLVIPGVTWKKQSDISGGQWPDMLAGKEYIILRREIRRLQEKRLTKDIDLLVYLHRPEQKKSIREWSRKTDLNIVILDEFSPDFPRLLALSHIFLSGFGISFYEALALEAFPITWAFSSAHRADAELFYQRLGLPPFLVDSADQLAEQLPVVNKILSNKAIVEIQDGTPRITSKIQSLLQETSP